MSSSILATGTAVPPHKMSQAQALAMFQDFACTTERQRRLAKVLFDRAQVENRFTFVPHQSAYQWCLDDQTPLQEITAGGALTTAPDSIPQVVAGTSPGLSTGQRMRLYDLYASNLAIASAKQAIANSNRTSNNITHLVTVSCTGFASPGVDVNLIRALSLPPTVERVNIGFMGCHGAVNGIRTAMNIANSNRAATVLVCCVELCSLHCRFQWGENENEKIIGNALFGDGSASLVIANTSDQQNNDANNDANNDSPDWEIIDTGSVLIDDSRASLRWDIGDHGFEMILGSDIGDRIEAALSNWLSQWLHQRGLSFDDIDFWAVHPGGPKIISAVQSSLRLSDEQLSVSMDVLRRCGNMSSPTVLFILEEFRKSMATAHPARTPQHAVVIAFGPGMVAEIALLKIGG